MPKANAGGKKGGGGRGQVASMGEESEGTSDLFEVGKWDSRIRGRSVRLKGDCSESLKLRRSTKD